MATRLFFLWLVVTLILGGVYFYFARPITVSAADNTTQRTLPSRILEHSRPFTTALVMNPVAACPPNTPPPSADVVLVLDRSGSMDSGLPQATAAIEALIAELDPTRNRFGLVLFSDQATIAVPLTNQPTDIGSALRSVEAGGGSTMAAGMALAGQMIAESPAGSRKIVVVFGDGQVDRGSVEREGELLRDDLVETWAVGVPGLTFLDFVVEPDLDTLAAAAGSSERVIAVANNDALVSTFTEFGIAVRTNSLPSQIMVTEGFNTEAFRFISTPTGVAQGNTLLWNGALVANIPQTLTYTLAPIVYGVHTVQSTATQGTMSLCDGSILPLGLIPSPSVLVVPPLLYGVVPWLILGGLFLMAAILRRLLGGKKDIPPPLTPGRYGPFGAGGAAVIPEALFGIHAPPDLDKLNVLRRGDPQKVEPHLIMAVGSPGRWWLTELKRRLIERYGSVPETVALLWVDMVAPGHAPPGATHAGIDLDPAREMAILRPDWEQIGSNLNKGIGRQPWWGNRNLNEAARARARLALATEIGKGTLRTVPIALALAAQKQKIGDKHTCVMVAFGGDEVGSGMLYDLLDLATHRVEANLRPSQRILLLGMGDVLADANTQRQQEQDKWANAALYEYERLLQNDVAWDSVARPVDGSLVYGSPFDITYLFSTTISKLEDTNVDKVDTQDDITLPNRELTGGSGAIVLEWVETLLDPAGAGTLRQQIQQEVGATSVTAGQLRVPLIGAIGAVNVQIPVDILNQWAKALFVNEIARGWSGVPVTVTVSREEVAAFLRGEATSVHHGLWTDIADWEGFSEENTFVSQFFQEATRLAGNSLAEMIRAYTLQELERTIGAPGLAFQKVLALIQGLEKRLGEIINREKGVTDPDRREVGRWLIRQQQQVTEWKNHLNRWLETFNRITQQTSTERQRTTQVWDQFLRTRTGKTSKLAVALETMKQEIENEMQAAAQTYARSRQGWVWAGLPAGGSFLLPALEEEGASLRKLPLESLSARCGFGAEQTEPIQQRLYQWAAWAASEIKHSGKYHLRQRATPTPPSRELASEVAAQGNYLMPFNKGIATDLLNPTGQMGRSAISVRTYLGPSSVTAPLSTTITDASRAKLSTTEDPFSLSVALTISEIPVETLESYLATAGKGTVRDRDQIFVAEQQARVWLERLRATLTDNTLDILYTEQGEPRADLPRGLAAIRPDLFPSANEDEKRATTKPLQFAAFRGEFRKWLNQAPALEWFTRGLVVEVLSLEAEQLAFTANQERIVIGAAHEWVTAVGLFLRWAAEEANAPAFKRLQTAIEEAKQSAGFDLQKQVKARLLQADVYGLGQSTLPLHQDLWYYLIAMGGYVVTH
jgi:hypothetical protein